MRKSLLLASIFFVVSIIIIFVRQQFFQKALFNGKRITILEAKKLDDGTLEYVIKEMQKHKLIDIGHEGLKETYFTNQLFYDSLCARIRQKLRIRILPYDLPTLTQFNKWVEEHEKNQIK